MKNTSSEQQTMKNTSSEQQTMKTNLTKIYTKYNDILYKIKNILKETNDNKIGGSSKKKVKTRKHKLKTRKRKLKTRKRKIHGGNGFNGLPTEEEFMSMVKFSFVCTLVICLTVELQIGNYDVLLQNINISFPDHLDLVILVLLLFATIGSGIIFTGVNQPNAIPNPPINNMITRPQESNQDECSICFDEFENEGNVRTLLPCNHKFHTRCINHWLQIEQTCPLCRADINLRR